MNTKERNANSKEWATLSFLILFDDCGYQISKAFRDAIKKIKEENKINLYTGISDLGQYRTYNLLNLLESKKLIFSNDEGIKLNKKEYRVNIQYLLEYLKIPERTNLDKCLSKYLELIPYLISTKQRETIAIEILKYQRKQSFNKISFLMFIESLLLELKEFFEGYILELTKTGAYISYQTAKRNTRRIIAFPDITSSEKDRNKFLKEINNELSSTQGKELGLTLPMKEKQNKKKKKTKEGKLKIYQPEIIEQTINDFRELIYFTVRETYSPKEVKRKEILEKLSIPRYV